MKPCIVLMMLLAWPALARPPDIGSDDYKALMPFRGWVERQHSPSGQWCCDIADGRTVEARIVDGHWQIYVTAEKFPGSTPGWREVPDEAVLREPNPVGLPIAWINQDRLYCFVPGSGA